MSGFAVTRRTNRDLGVPCMAPVVRGWLTPACHVICAAERMPQNRAARWLGDCASLEANGHRNYLERGLFSTEVVYHSPRSADPKVTVRVLTVMLASEY